MDGSNGIANIDIMDNNGILGQDGFSVFFAPKIIDIGADKNVIMDYHDGGILGPLQLLHHHNKH